MADQEWESLRAAWQAAAPSPAELRDRVRAGRRRLQLSLAIEWIASASVAIFWAVVIARRPAPVTIAMGVASVAIVAVWLVLLHRTMRNAWSPASASVKGHLAVSIERARAMERWLGTLVPRFCFAMVVFHVPWALWKASVDAAMYAHEPWRAVVGFGGFYVILIGILWSTRTGASRAQREGDEQTAVLRALEASDTPG